MIILVVNQILVVPKDIKVIAIANVKKYWCHMLGVQKKLLREGNFVIYYSWSATCVRWIALSLIFLVDLFVVLNWIIVIVDMENKTFYF